MNPFNIFNYDQVLGDFWVSMFRSFSGGVSIKFNHFLDG